jgi:hypothetical protein
MHLNWCKNVVLAKSCQAPEGPESPQAIVNKANIFLQILRIYPIQVAIMEVVGNC